MGSNVIPTSSMVKIRMTSPDRHSGVCHCISNWNNNQKRQISVCSGLVWPTESCQSARDTVSSSQKEKNQVAEDLNVTKEGI